MCVGMSDLHPTAQKVNMQIEEESRKKTVYTGICLALKSAERLGDICIEKPYGGQEGHRARGCV